MASTTCGRCKALTHMTEITGLFEDASSYDIKIQEQAFKCDNCGRLNLHSSVHPQRVSYTVGGFHGSDEWLPRPLDRREFPDVPDHIAGGASEATLCLSVGAYRAAGALARAVVEATAKEKGADGRDLFNRIEALAAADHIRPHTKEQAHEIRHFGNGMAHGDFVDHVEKEEAEEVVELMAEVLDEVYQSPARLAARKAARLARTADTPETAP